MDTNPKKIIGILSTLQAPLLSQNLKEIVKKKSTEVFLILDLKGLKSEDLGRWNERTNGFFEDSTISLGSLINHRIKIYFVDDHNDPDCISLINFLKTDLLINCGTPRKLSKNFLLKSGCDILNIHPGILPNYRGSSCVEWAILNDDPIGNTAHFMVEEYDAGPIIDSEAYNFKKNSSYSDIRNKVYLESIKLMSKSIDKIFVENLSRENMQNQQETYPVYPPISDKEMVNVMEIIKENKHKSIIL